MALMCYAILGFNQSRIIKLRKLCKELTSRVVQFFVLVEEEVRSVLAFNSKT